MYMHMYIHVLYNCIHFIENVISCHMVFHASLMLGVNVCI